MLSDRVFYPCAALLAVALIALATVYPQGQGARSPKPFGHATWMETRPKKPATPMKGPAPSDKVQLKGPF